MMIVLIWAVHHHVTRLHLTLHARGVKSECFQMGRKRRRYGVGAVKKHTFKSYRREYKLPWLFRLR
jgi:hypothetical protein